MLEALASTQSAATGLLEQMRGVRRKLACETTTNRQYIERNFEDIYQDACVRFEGRLTNVVSHPEETAVLERLAVAQRLDDWWPETVRDDFEEYDRNKRTASATHAASSEAQEYGNLEI